MASTSRIKKSFKITERNQGEIVSYVIIIC